MFEGNWECSNCKNSIKELPFEPRGTDNLLCRDCHSKKGGNGSTGERKMYEGNWQCGNCGNKITKLPFEPRETGNLKCLDCFKKSA
jgi:CxxC-x17-CxxC domain-containing protein